MTVFSRLKKHPNAFRRMTGITPEKFDEIFLQLKPVYKEWNEQRLARPKRKRKIGGGRPFDLGLEDRLLMLLIYYRTYVTHVFLGFLFRIDDSNVGRNINPLQPLLAKIFRIPERKVEITEDEMIALFFDGTEQPINRPKRGQRKWYSGKKKRHTIKHQVVVARKRKNPGRSRKRQKRKVRIAAVSKSFTGKTHDKKMYEQTRTVSPSQIPKKGDTGYLGTALEIPWKKPKGRELTQCQKRSNRRFSSERVTVEHGIGKMKIWRMASERFRNRLHTHTVMFKNVAGLHNLMFA
jgi:hypothetical protein